MKLDRRKAGTRHRPLAAQQPPRPRTECSPGIDRLCRLCRQHFGGATGRCGSHAGLRPLLLGDRFAVSSRRSTGASSGSSAAEVCVRPELASFVADVGRNLRRDRIGNAGGFGSDSLLPLVRHTHCERKLAWKAEQALPGRRVQQTARICGSAGQPALLSFQDG